MTRVKWDPEQVSLRDPCGMDVSDLDAISPEDASRGAIRDLHDADLPMLGAVWLATGYDSESLRELAAMTKHDGPQARRLTLKVLSSLGYPPVRINNPGTELAWRGYWPKIRWAQREMDILLTPYAAVQTILAVASDEPDLWGPAHGDELVQVLLTWDQDPDRRHDLDAQLRSLVARLEEAAVPPIEAPTPLTESDF